MTWIANVTRRNFIKGVAGGMCAMSVGDAGSVFAAAEEDVMIQQRRHAAHRRRRIIFNNDGDDSWMATKPTPEAYLDRRIRPAFDNTQVDSMFLSTTEDIGYYLHRSEFTQLFKRDHPGIALSGKVKLVEALDRQGTDILEIGVDHVHKQGKEIFWTHRMNGMEDMGAEFLLGDFKRDHPQWWLATPEFGKRFAAGDPRHWYRVMDYDIDEVREYVLKVIQEVITNYDIDGVELDYLRDPWLFKETFSDPMQPATSAHCAMMVDFHQRVRQMLDTKARKIGRPLLLALRVPKWPDISKFLGLDIEANLKSGAVDLLTGSGGYSPFAVPETFLALAKRYDVPAYLCISTSGMVDRSKHPDARRTELMAWRGAAMNLWNAGVHGQYVFNTFPQGMGPSRALDVMREIGEPAAMAGKPALFMLDNWDEFAAAGYCNHAIKRNDLLPIHLGEGEGRRSCTFYVGHNRKVLEASTIGLRAYFRNKTASDSIDMVINSHKLIADSANNNYADYTVSPEQVRVGRNNLSGHVKRAEGVKGDIDLLHFELIVTPPV